MGYKETSLARIRDTPLRPKKVPQFACHYIWEAKCGQFRGSGTYTTQREGELACIMCATVSLDRSEFTIMSTENNISAMSTTERAVVPPKHGTESDAAGGFDDKDRAVSDRAVLLLP